jgi:hypothetical protein
MGELETILPPFLEKNTKLELLVQKGVVRHEQLLYFRRYFIFVRVILRWPGRG